MLDRFGRLWTQDTQEDLKTGYQSLDRAEARL
jgi:hypothetical protein